MYVSSSALRIGPSDLFQFRMLSETMNDVWYYSLDDNRLLGLRLRIQYRRRKIANIHDPIVEWSMKFRSFDYADCGWISDPEGSIVGIYFVMHGVCALVCLFERFIVPGESICILWLCTIVWTWIIYKYLHRANRSWKLLQSLIIASCMEQQKDG
jgi:hypothetical protein